MKEKWKWIKGFEGLYKISNKGRVKSYHKKDEGYIMSSKNVSGYEVITLYRNHKCYYQTIHRLVAETFIDNPKNKPQINHKDMDKHNNCVDNLEWVTASENRKHAAKNKPSSVAGMIEYNKTKTSKPVIQIDPETNEVVNEFHSMSEAKRQTGIDNSNISNVANKKRDKEGYKYKTAGGYKWVFKGEN